MVLQALAIGMWLVIAVIWIVWTFPHANTTLRRWRSCSSRADALEHLAHDELAALLNTVPASDSMPEGSEPYIRCLFSSLGIPEEQRPRES